MRLSDENLRGRTVIGADGRAVGEIAALFLDSDAWTVEELRVKLRKEIADELGASRTLFPPGRSRFRSDSSSPLVTLSCSPSRSTGFARCSRGEATPLPPLTFASIGVR
jgi:hypothetical protein